MRLIEKITDRYHRTRLNWGLYRQSIAPAQVKESSTKCHGVIQEPQVIEKSSIAVQTYSPYMYEHIQEESGILPAKLLWNSTTESFFTLEGQAIWNMDYYWKHGRDEPLLRRLIRINYPRIKVLASRLTFWFLFIHFIYKEFYV